MSSSRLPPPVVSDPPHSPRDADGFHGVTWRLVSFCRLVFGVFGHVWSRLVTCKETNQRWKPTSHPILNAVLWRRRGYGWHQCLEEFYLDSCDSCASMLQTWHAVVFPLGEPYHFIQLEMVKSFIQKSEDDFVVPPDSMSGHPGLLMDVDQALAQKPFIFRRSLLEPPLNCDTSLIEKWRSELLLDIRGLTWNLWAPQWRTSKSCSPSSLAVHVWAREGALSRTLVGAVMTWSWKLTWSSQKV